VKPQGAQRGMGEDVSRSGPTADATRAAAPGRAQGADPVRFHCGDWIEGKLYGEIPIAGRASPAADKWNTPMAIGEPAADIRAASRLSFIRIENVAKRYKSRQGE